MKDLVYKFKLTKDLAVLADHSVQNVRWHVSPYGGRTRLASPSLFLVRDAGVYLVSPETRPGAPEDARCLTLSGKLLCIYAEQCGPNSALPAVVEGDDFVLVIPSAGEITRAFYRGKKELVITLVNFDECWTKGQVVESKVTFA